MESTPSSAGPLGAGLPARLHAYAPVPGRTRTWSGDPPRVLHLLSQQPGKTGSGVALLALVRETARRGWRQRAVIGLPADEPLPDIPPLATADVVAARFEQPPVPYPIPGMSDIMPYRSTRFSDLTPGMLDGYLRAFGAALGAATVGFQPDLIQCHHLWLLAALARVRFPGTPLFVYSHGTELRQLQTAPRLAPFVLPACSDADRVFALHPVHRDRVVEAYGIPAERVRVIGAGFREELFKPGPAGPPEADRQELVVAYAGKISAPKGVPWLIEAMRRVQAPDGRRVKLLLAGSAGRGEDAVRRAAAGMDNVVFLGALPQAELAAVLQSADVFVLPSFFEGLPLVVVEAFACGCRVVMTDLPGTDGWMPAGLCEARWVERVPLPRLIGADVPLADDLPVFVDRLAAAISRQLAEHLHCRRPEGLEGLLAPLSWSGVFARVAAAYDELNAPLTKRRSALFPPGFRG